MALFHSQTRRHMIKVVNFFVTNNTELFIMVDLPMHDVLDGILVSDFWPYFTLISAIYHPSLTNNGLKVNDFLLKTL